MLRYCLCLQVCCLCLRHLRPCDLTAFVRRRSSTCFYTGVLQAAMRFRLVKINVLAKLWDQKPEIFADRPSWTAKPPYRSRRTVTHARSRRWDNESEKQQTCHISCQTACKAHAPRLHFRRIHIIAPGRDQTKVTSLGFFWSAMKLKYLRTWRIHQQEVRQKGYTLKKALESDIW